MPFFCFSLSSYLDLFVLAVNCGQEEEGRFEINVEKDLVDSLPSSRYPKIPKKNFTGFYTEVNPESFFFSNEIFEKLRKSLVFKAEKSGCNFCFN